MEVNIAIMRPFVQLRWLMYSNALLAEKIEALEEKYADHDQQFQLVFEAIKQLIASPVSPAKELGFHTLLPLPIKYPKSTIINPIEIDLRRLDLRLLIEDC